MLAAVGVKLLVSLNRNTFLITQLRIVSLRNKHFVGNHRTFVFQLSQHFLLLCKKGRQKLSSLRHIKGKAIVFHLLHQPLCLMFKIKSLYRCLLLTTLVIQSFRYHNVLFIVIKHLLVEYSPYIICFIVVRISPLENTQAIPIRL